MLKINSIIELKYWLKKWNKKTPAKINIKSETEHIKQTKNICCFFNPCSITKIFCAPIAKIRLKPVKKPNNRYSIKCY